MLPFLPGSKLSGIAIIKNWAELQRRDAVGVAEFHQPKDCLGFALEALSTQLQPTSKLFSLA